jgi:indole-3-glycerol phosphate synthase
LEEEALAKANEAAEELRRERQAARAKVVTNVNMQSKAPRDENGELLLKRREIHAGRAISVSTVEWSVADKTAMPTSTLEGFMWDKETEVDRFRERVPLSNLVSQCRLSMVDPNMPKPRDFVGPIVQAAQQQSERFVIIPECKRKEPTTGSIRKRYDVAKLVKQFTLAGAPAISVNCDAVLFGGSLDDITLAREAAALAAVSTATLDSDGVVVPPILASDLILYPYQLYKLRLAGADAVNLLAGALANKDMIYLTKIAASLQLQCLVTVTSEVQLRELSALAPGSINGLIVSNREVSCCRR